MVRYLKQAEPRSRQDNRDLVDRVRNMIADIEQNGDEVVRRQARLQIPFDGAPPAGRNPVTGKVIQNKASKRVAFRS